MKKFLLIISCVLVSLNLFSQNVDSLLLIGDFSSASRLTDSTYTASINFIDNQFRSRWLPEDIKNGYDVIDAKGDWYTVISISNTFAARTDIILKEVYAVAEVPVGRVQVSGPLPTGLLPVGPINERGLNSIMSARIQSYNFARLLQFLDETKAGYALTRDAQDSLEVDTTIIPTLDKLAAELAKIVPTYEFDGVGDVITITNDLGTTTLTIKSDFTATLDGRFLELMIDDTVQRLDLQPLLFELDSLVAGDTLVGLAPILTGSTPSEDYYLFKDTDSGADSLRIQAPYGDQGHKPLAYLIDIVALQDSIAAHLILINNNATNITELFDTTTTIRSDLNDVDNLVSTLRDSVGILNSLIENLPAADSIINFEIVGDSVWTLTTTNQIFKDSIPYIDKQALYDSLASHLGLINTNITNITLNGDSIAIHTTWINNLDDSIVAHRGDLDSLYGQVDSIITEISTFEATVTNADSVTNVNTIQDSIYVVYTADGNTHLDTIHFTKYINIVLDSIAVHRAILDNHTEAIADLVDSIAQHRIELDNNADSLAQQRIDINNNIDSLLAQRQDINTNIDSLTEHRIDINANYDSVAVLRAEITTIYDSLTTHRVEINTLYDSLIVHRIDINKNIDSLVQHRIEINNILDSLIALRIDINNNYDSLVVHRTDINNNIDSLVQHRIEINSLFDSVLVHRGEIDNNVDSLVSHRVDINNLIDSIGQHRIELDSLFSLLAEITYPVADSITDFYTSSDSILIIETADGNTFQTTVNFTVYINALLDSLSDHWAVISANVDSIADHRILLDSLLARDNIENAYTTNNYLYIQTRDSLYELDVYRDGYQVLDTTITDSWTPGAYLNNFDFVKIHSITSNNQDVTLTLPQASTVEGLPMVYTSYATSGYRNFIVSNQDMVLDHEPDGQVAVDPGDYGIEDKVVLNDSLLTETYTMYEVRSHETNGAQIRWWITNNNRKVSSNISYKFNEQTTVEGALDSLFNRVDNDNQVASEVPYTNNSQTTTEGALDSLFNRDVELVSDITNNANDITTIEGDITEINDTLASRRGEIDAINSALDAYFDSLGLHRTDINILYGLINNTIGGDSITDFTINNSTLEFAITTNDGNIFKDTLEIAQLQIITDSITAHRTDINDLYDIVNQDGGINEVADSTTGFVTVQDSILRITTADGNTFETTVNFTKYFNELSDSINVHRVVLTEINDTLSALRVDVNQLIDDLAGLNSNSVLDVFDEVEFHVVETTDSTYRISRYNVLDTTITANWNIPTLLFNKYDEIRIHAFTIGDQVTITLPPISAVNKTLVYITADPASGASDPVVLNGVNNVLMSHRPYNLTSDYQVINAHGNSRDSLYLVDAPHLEPYVRYELQALPYMNSLRYWFLTNPNRKSAANIEYFANNQENVQQGLDSLFRRRPVVSRDIGYDGLSVFNGSTDKIINPQPEDTITIQYVDYVYKTQAGLLTADIQWARQPGDDKVVLDMAELFGKYDIINLNIDENSGDGDLADTTIVLLPKADSFCITREFKVTVAIAGLDAEVDARTFIKIDSSNTSLVPAMLKTFYELEYIPANPAGSVYGETGRTYNGQKEYYYNAALLEPGRVHTITKGWSSFGYGLSVWEMRIPLNNTDELTYQSETDTIVLETVLDSLLASQLLDAYKSNDTIYIKTGDSLFAIKDSLGTFLSNLIEYTNNGQTNVEEALDALFNQATELNDSITNHRTDINELLGKDRIVSAYSSGDSVYIETEQNLYGMDVGLMTLDTTITHFMGGNVEYDFTYAANTYDIINISVTNTAFGDIVSVVIPDYSTGIRAKTITLSAFNIPGAVITVDGNRLSSTRFDAADTEFSNTVGSDTTYVYYTGNTYFPQASNVYKYTAANFTGSNLWFVQSYQNESHNIAYDENGVETVNQGLDSLFNRNFIEDVSVSDDSTTVVTRDSTYRIPNSSQEFTLFKNAYAGNGGRILDTLIAAVGSDPLVVDLSSNSLQNRYTDVKIQLAAVIAGGNPSDNVFIKLPNSGGKLQRIHIYPSPLGASVSYYAISSDNISSSISTMPTDELVKYQTGFDSLVSHYVNDTVRIPYSTSTLFTRVGITITSETSWWVDYNTSNQQTINSIQDQLDGLDGTVADFYKENGDAVLVTSDSTYRVSLDSLNFGNRVYFSKAIGDNATGERGNPAKPFADPWSAFSASQDGDIITGLTRDTFNLITGDPQLGGSEFYALNGRIYVAAGLSKSIHIEFFDGSVIKGDNTSNLASFAVDQGDNDLVIKNVKFEGNSSHPYFDAYVYGSPGEPRNFIFENVAIDSIGSSYFETYQANADLHFTEITASNEGTGFHQFYMDPDLDNLTTSIRVDKSNCVFDENYIEGGYNSTNNTILYSVNTDKENVLTIQGIEGSTINLDVNSPASGLYFYTDSCLINVNLIGTADEYDALGLDFYNLIEVSGDNNLVEGTLNGMFYAGTNYSGEALSITGANNDVTFTGEIEILNSDIYDCLFYLEDDSTNQVLVKDFMIVNWDAPIFRATTTGFSQESEFTFVNSFIETLDSTFLDAGNRTNSLNPFKLVNTTINYVGTDNVTSFLNENWTYELDGFSSNVPEFDNQIDYDNQITYISNKSLEDKLKYQDVNINGGDNVLRIGSGTPPKQIIASSRQTTQFSSTEGNVNFVANGVGGTVEIVSDHITMPSIDQVNTAQDSVLGVASFVNDTLKRLPLVDLATLLQDSIQFGGASFNSVDTVVTQADWTPLPSFWKANDIAYVAANLETGDGDCQITLPAPDSSYMTQMYLQVWDESGVGDVRLITGTSIIYNSGTTTSNLVLSDTVLYRVSPVRSRNGTGSQYYWRVDVLTSDPGGSGGGGQTAATLTGFTDTTQVLRDSIQALKNMLYPAKDTVASASTTNLSITSQAQTFVISGTTTITTLNLNTPIDGGTVTIFFQGSLDVTFGSNVIDLDAGDGTTSLGTVSTGGFKVVTLLYHDGKFYGRD
jgi:hypothetical protein